MLSFERWLTAISSRQVLNRVRAGLMSGGFETHGAARATVWGKVSVAPHLESMRLYPSPSKSRGATLAESRA